MNQTQNEPLDRLTKIVTQAGGISGDEADRIASSSFMHARLRAGIEAERRRRAEQGSGWLVSLLVASRAIAVLTAVTMGAVLTLWFSKPNAPLSAPLVIGEAENVSRVVTGGTCALSTTQECAISTEEVLATLLTEKGGETPK